MRWLLVIALLSVCCSLPAQDIETSGPSPKQEWDSVRAYYIKHFPDHFFIYPVLKQRSLNFELEQQGDGGRLVTFKPNNSYSFGLGLYLFEVGFELAFAIPIDEKSKAIYGESDARDLQLNVLGKRWGVDAFYQRYNGFYVTDSEEETLPDTPYPQRADVESRNFGLTGNYVFNNRKFSFRSAYNFAEHQVFSKGSFLLFTTISSFRFDADSAIINEAQRAAFGEDVAFTNLQYTTFSIAPGYTYSIVYQNFFLNGALSVGPAHQWMNYTLDGRPDKHDTGINSFVAARISLGYNGDRLFGGISFLSQGNNVQFEDVRFSNNNGSFKVLVGYRFQEWGFLKKRVWDLVPFKI
jgi:hypothetical protein